MLKRFFFKHQAFEWEREFRLAVSMRMAEENGVQVPDRGIFVEVHLTTLVEKIVLGSTTTKEERASAMEHIRQAGLITPEMIERPSYIYSLII